MFKQGYIILRNDVMQIMVPYTLSCYCLLVELTAMQLSFQYYIQNQIKHSYR